MLGQISDDGAHLREAVFMTCSANLAKSFGRVTINAAQITADAVRLLQHRAFRLGTTLNDSAI